MHLHDFAEKIVQPAMNFSASNSLINDRTANNKMCANKYEYYTSSVSCRHCYFINDLFAHCIHLVNT